MVTKWTKSNHDRATDVFATYAYNRKLEVEGGIRVTFEHSFTMHPVAPFTGLA